MSISVDKYFGWTIDLKADLNCNDFDFYQKFIDKYPNLDQEESCMPNLDHKIKLVLDGMNGSFARLIYQNLAKKTPSDVVSRLGMNLPSFLRIFVFSFRFLAAGYIAQVFQRLLLQQ